MKRAVIIGAGPAGLTTAYELLEKSSDYEVFVLEESGTVGGISRTVNHNGNRMDMGGHRFFSKVQEVNDWWEKFLPQQGEPSFDAALLGRKSVLQNGGPDPQKIDNVMLVRERLSRIFFMNKFFDYPVSLKFSTIKNMGFFTTLVVGFSYIKSAVFKRHENSLEDFYINRFGKKLYSMFFENYTENLWGRHPSEISPEWGAQRVKGLSVLAILRDMFGKIFAGKNRKVETSLIEEFKYPKLGPGLLWEVVSETIKSHGGKILFGRKVVSINKNADGKIESVVCEHDGHAEKISGDVFVSSMPVKDLVCGMSNVPANIKEIADGLPYRDYMTVGVLVPRLKLKNETKIKTLGNIVPDDWIYVHDKKVRMGRIQIFNNWSPYMVKDAEHTVWVGLEYFCNEGDEMWNMGDDEFAHFAINEMVQMNLIDSEKEVLDFHTERVKKAYPAYFDSYSRIDEVRDFLDTIPNIFCVGRNGQHRYNNIDHSMCTAFESVKNILADNTDKSNVWNVNTEKEYHEEK